MIELRFDATEVGCVDENGALVCGASNSKSKGSYHYITIQGCSESNDEDGDGIHFEIDDQINADYDLLASCSVSRSQICIDLFHDVTWYPGLRRVVVNCEGIPKEQLDGMIAGLRTLFRDRPGDLHVESR